MKRILCLVLALFLIAAVFAGCGKKDKEDGSSSALPSTLPTVTPSPSPAPQMAKAALIKADAGLNVRKAPSTDSEILGLAPNGSKLPLVVETPKDGWYEVHYKGKSAYVSAEYAEVKEVTLEEYNKLKAGSEGSGTSSKTDDPDGAKSSSKPESEVSSKAPVSSAPEPSQGKDSEDGE